MQQFKLKGLDKFAFKVSDLKNAFLCVSVTKLKKT